ncbi:phage portal protein [Paracoccus sp. R12_1]|uniref:phage portal protein n=1 Tax=unclassified Paracoccus (in: a-proteobacteria) TaxID=2688777 RepID=UPI001AD95589|nr:MULTISPECIES: phage portal protein [unclassified Paracoccus (in: a-proteobacteria)]MBO9457324.1 phage portal protein [Paracoccus sp. R12_2]MBO9488627.1 phage portal protein [Paracoccus sp. R12_1]
MNILDRTIELVSPMAALRRAQARSALDAMMRYEAATAGRRGASWRPVASDADTAADPARQRLAFIARDMIRNTAFATRVQAVVANNVVGDGIIPKVRARSKRSRDSMLASIEAHCDTTAIDADGRQNLYGLQRLAMNTIVDAGEVLIRYRPRDLSDGLPLPFQIEVLEPDYLDVTRDGVLQGGNRVENGIEFDKFGRRVAYYLHAEHPGALGGLRNRWASYRVPADRVLHIFRQDRPKQMRGVSWYAPIAMRLQDFADGQDAHLMRQKIAACFTAFRVAPDADLAGTDPEDPAGLATMSPGRIQNLQPGEDVRFGTPPGVTGVEEFYRWVMRAVSADMGLTYEAVTNDFSGVNFSSARMARMEMDRNVSSWQWLMMVPQMMQPIGRWLVEAWSLVNQQAASRVMLDWVPPPRVIVDPTREILSMADQVRAGFASRSEMIRRLGYDPERVTEEISAERMADREGNLVFDSDAGAVAALRAYPAEEAPAQKEKTK